MPARPPCGTCAAIFAIRGTRRLLDALKVKPVNAPPEPTTKLGNWYANLLPLAVDDFLICASEKTLLPVAVPISALPNLASELSKALALVLTGLGIGRDPIEQERFGMAQVSFSTTASRQVVGFMNEFAFMMSVRLEEERRVSMTDLSLWFAGTPCRSLFPDKATQEVFGARHEALEPAIATQSGQARAYRTGSVAKEPIHSRTQRSSSR